MARLLLCLLLLAPVAAGAEGMAPLEGLVGDWRLVPTDPDLARTLPEGSSVVRPLYDGVALEEELEVFVPDGSSFRIRHLISWDRFRRVYRVAALDDGTGLLDVYEGVWADGGLTVSNLAAGTFFPNAEGGWNAFRLRWWDIDADGFRFEAAQSADAGVSWTPYVSLHYRRAESDE